MPQEATNKFWKFNMLMAGLVATIGGCIFALTLTGFMGSLSWWEPAFGVLLLILGLIWFMVARLCAWWFHG
jgi:hypothetical protein